jgi:hypothetical protein
VDIPTFAAYFQQSDVLEQLKSSEPLNSFIGFFATLGLVILKMADLPPSRGYEPLLIRYGVDPILARGMARIVIGHGRRRAAESEWHRPVFEAIRFLAEPDRRQDAILRRARLLLEGWDKTSIIETAFHDIDLIETEFIGLLKALVEGRVVDCRRITEIAARVAPHLSIERGPRISAATAAHEFFLACFVSLTGLHAYTWSTLEDDFIDDVTGATRLEFDEPDFDPRPAHRRRKAGRAVEID